MNRQHSISLETVERALRHGDPTIAYDATQLVQGDIATRLAVQLRRDDPDGTREFRDAEQLGAYLRFEAREALRQRRAAGYAAPRPA